MTDVEVAPNPYNTLHVASSFYNGDPIAGLILLSTAGGTIPVFCVDLLHDIYIGEHTPAIPYMTGSVTTDSTGTDSGTGNLLTGTKPGAIQTLVDSGFYDYVHNVPNLGDRLTALQGAIWAIEYNATVSSDSADSSIAADINSLIGFDVLFGDNHPASFSFGLYPVGEGQGFGTTQGFVVGVPESSTWAMMFLGFASLGYAAFHRGARREAVTG